MRGLATLLSTLRILASARTRVMLAASVVLSAISRLLVIALAATVFESNQTRTAALVVLAATLVVVQRALGAAVRVAVDCDAHRAAASALLNADVLAVNTFDVRRAVDDGTYYSQDIIGGVLPPLVGDVLVSMAVLPLIVETASRRITVLGVISIVVVVVLLMLLRGTIKSVQDRSVEARMKLGDTFAHSVEGRLELVARGAEDAFQQALRVEVSRYAQVMNRAAFGSAILTRIPVAVAVLVVAVVIFVDDESRAAVFGAPLASLLVLSACGPPLLGAIMGTQSLARGVASLKPFLSTLNLPRRHDGGQESVSLPTQIDGKRISFAYDAKQPCCLKDVSFSWRRGAALVLMGPNGSGKSTLLRLILGLRPPTRGVLMVQGRDMLSFDLPALRRQIAYVPQRPFLGVDHTSVRESLRFVRRDASDTDMAAVLERVGLNADFVERRLGELSGGQRQRLSLARALLQDPPAYLFDEPDANLDSDGVVMLRSLIEKLLADGRMVAIAAHTADLANLSNEPITLPGADA